MAKQNGKHKTEKASDYVKKPDSVERAKQEFQDEYDALERQDTSLDLAGWFSPKEDQAPITVKGEILQCIRRKNPTKKQTALFFVLRLANDVEGLRFPEGKNRDSEGYPDTLQAGECVGIDMRQALERLENYRGPVKIVFVEKIDVDDRQWWRTEVYAKNLPAESPRRISNQDRDKEDAEALDKAF
jgi:hypothetical protein